MFTAQVFTLLLLLSCTFFCQGQLLPCEKDYLDEFPRAHQLTDVFSAQLELVNFENFESNPVYAQLNYDGANNRMTVAYTQNAHTSTIILDYGQGHSITYSDTQDECSIEKIEDGSFKAEMLQLFPFLDMSTEREDIFKPELLFGARGNERYLGNSDCRSQVDCESWVFCHNDQTGTKNLIFHWTKTNWAVPSEVKPILLGYEILSRDQRDNATIRKQLVNVLRMDDTVDALAFQVVEGMICHSSGTFRPFPLIPTSGTWTFQTEVIFNQRRKIINTHTWFDFTNNLARLTYTNGDNKFITNTADWTGDVVHVQTERQCWVHKLESGVFPTIGIDEIPIIQFGNGTNMFQVDGPSDKWLYIGKRFTRKMWTHVWQHQRNDWPYPPRYASLSLWDWHFVEQNEQLVPVYLRIRILSAANDVPIYTDNSIMEYNVFGFSNEQFPNVDHFDVSDCYTGEKRHLQFQLEDSARNSQIKIKDAAYFAQNQFLWVLKISISVVAEISALRISRVRTVIVDNSKLFVQFYLLDKLTNSTKEIIDKEINLSEAKKNLINTIDSGHFVLPFDNHEYRVISHTLSDVVVNVSCPIGLTFKKSRNIRATNSNSELQMKSTHSPDDVVGVSIGCFLSGLAIGAAATLLIAVKKGTL